MTTPPIRLRPNVLAHPSPTTGRFLLLIAAMLSTGLLVGTLVHNGLLGAAWGEMAIACFAKANDEVPQPADVFAEIAHNNVLSACMAPAERARAWFDVAGALLIALLGVAVLLATPAYIKRREKLREAGERLAGARQRIDELAAEVGLSTAPRLMLGRAGQRDAFVFGLPGRYYLVLPTALVVRWRSRAYFDPVVRHELAHLKRHDVPLAWLASAVWVAAVPVILLPLAAMLVRWEFSILPPYLWRVALFMVVIWLIRRQALRSREHDADLHAARQGGDWQPLASVLQMASTQATGWWRRFVSNHPTVAQRVAVLTDPGRLRGVSFVDGLAGGFLTALLLPALSGTLGILLTQTPFYGYIQQIVALVIGPIAGLAIGVGLWRQAMIDQVTGEKVWPGAAVFGFVGGLLLGHWSGLNDLGLGGGDWSYSEPVIILTGAGAVLLSAGTGRLWADAASRLPGGPRSWWLGFVVNGLIFAMALWVLQWLPVVLTSLQAGKFGIDTMLVTSGQLINKMVFVPLLPVVVAAAAMVRRRHGLPLPSWLLEGGPTAWPLSAREPGLGPALLSGVVSGALAALGTAAYRLVMGRPTDDEVDLIGRYMLWLLLGMGVALAVSFVTMVVVPRSGGAVGLITGLSAAIVAGLGTVAINTFAFGNILEPRFWWQTTSSIVGLWFLGYLVLLPVTLATWPASWRDVPGWLLATLTVIAAGVVALCVVGLAIALR